MGPLFAVTFPIALSTILLLFLVAREPKGGITGQDFWNFVALGIAGHEGTASLFYNLLDRPFTAWGAYVEKYRRARGVYPPSGNLHSVAGRLAEMF